MPLPPVPLPPNHTYDYVLALRNRPDGSQYTELIVHVWKEGRKRNGHRGPITIPGMNGIIQAIEQRLSTIDWVEAAKENPSPVPG